MSLLDKLGQFFTILGASGEVHDVFQAFIDIWNAIPEVLRFVIVMCFTLACTIAILKMLF